MTTIEPRRRRPSPLLLCLAPLLIAGCASVKTAPAGCTPLFRDAMVTEVYFGLSGPGGRAIAKKDWQAFLNSDVVVAFPDGFTVIPAQGYWRGEGMAETAKENSLIFKVVHPAGPGGIDEAVRDRKTLRQAVPAAGRAAVHDEDGRRDLQLSFV